MIAIKSRMIFLIWLTLILLGVIAGCGGGGGGDDDDTDDSMANISGTITDSSGNGISGATVNAIRFAGGSDNIEFTTTTDSSGNFTITVVRNEEGYFEVSKTGYITVNTQFGSYDSDASGMDLGLPTAAEAQSIIDAAYPMTTPPWNSYGWLLVDVKDSSSNFVDQATISTSVSGLSPIYTECDGSPSVGSITVAPPCVSPTRDAPMYMQYFSANRVMTITTTHATINFDSVTAPVRDLEITYVDVEE